MSEAFSGPGTKSGAGAPCRDILGEFHGFPDVVVEHARRCALNSSPSRGTLPARSRRVVDGEDPVEAGRGDQDRQQRRGQGKQNRHDTAHHSYGKGVRFLRRRSRARCRERMPSTNTQATDAPNSAVPKVSPVAPTSDASGRSGPSA